MSVLLTSPSSPPLSSFALCVDAGGLCYRRHAVHPASSHRRHHVSAVNPHALCHLPPAAAAPALHTHSPSLPPSSARYVPTEWTKGGDAITPLSGYEAAKPMLFASVFPVDTTELEGLFAGKAKTRVAMLRMKPMGWRRW